MNCMSEAFRRLRWSVFEDISTILVAPTSEDPGAAWLPFLGHPIAAEPASETPLRAIGFTCEVLNNYDCLDDVREGKGIWSSLADVSNIEEEENRRDSILVNERAERAELAGSLGQSS
jgi:hypothetical protein